MREVLRPVGGTADWTTTVYIDGVPHLVEHLGETFFADAPDHPRVRCSQHRIGRAAADHLVAGGAVRTLGHTYSLVGPKP